MWLATVKRLVLLGVAAMLLMGGASCLGRSPRDPQPTERTLAPVMKMRDQAVDRSIGRWAVVVGISDYQYDTDWNRTKGIPDLQYANADARAFADFLLSPQGGAFPADRVMLLTDRQATVKEIRKGIGDFLARSLENDIVIFYFAGHGAPDPKNPDNLYLICHDTEPDNFYGTAFPMWEINTAVQRAIHAKRVFILTDACHSAGVSGSRSLGAAAKFNTYMEKLAQSKKGVTKITASRSDEFSLEHEFPEGGHGLFTHYLLKALKGEGDRDGDGFVTMKEAYDFLYDRVRSDSRHSQNPWASAYVSADIPLGIVDRQVIEAVKVRAEAEQRRRPVQGNFFEPPVAQNVNPDSTVALKIARAKLAKEEPGTAMGIVNAVLARNDQAKPMALAQKIEIQLAQKDFAGAENTEDLLVIPYPDSPAAKSGSRRIYEHYLEMNRSLADEEKIRNLNTYIRHHPGGLWAQEAQKEQEHLQAGIKKRCKRTFDEQILLAKGFSRRERFDQAFAALDKAAQISREARSQYGISLDDQRVQNLRYDVEAAKNDAVNRDAYQKMVSAAARAAEDEKIIAYKRFVTENPGNPYNAKAQKALSVMQGKYKSKLQEKYDRLLAVGQKDIRHKDFAGALAALDEAQKIYDKGRDELSIDLDAKNAAALRQAHQQEARKYRDYTAWSGADRSAREIPLNDTSDYDRRIAVYNDFLTKWGQNPYARNARQAVATLTDQRQSFRRHKFGAYFGQAESAFIAKRYTDAYSLLDQAGRYADSAQKRRIEALAAKYNAPPEVTLVLNETAVDWETPVAFSFKARDKEGDPVRVVRWDFGDGGSSTESAPRHAYKKWAGPEKEKAYQVQVEVTDGKSRVRAVKSMTVKKQDRIKTITVGNVSFKMIRIPAGEFTMGSPEGETGRDSDEDQHRVRITRNYFMGETEVTQGLWQAVMGANPSRFSNCGQDCPVEQVSWEDCQAFIKRLNRQTGLQFRLPTEAEWEYACRAGSRSALANGDISETECGYDANLARMGWYCGNAKKTTHPAAQKQANDWGLYDMHGNVWEWCQDWYDSYPNGTVSDPAGPSSGSYRVIRGGSWSHNARFCRSAFRYNISPGNRATPWGFGWPSPFRSVLKASIRKSRLSGGQSRLTSRTGTKWSEG